MEKEYQQTYIEDPITKKGLLARTYLISIELDEKWWEEDGEVVDRICKEIKDLRAYVDIPLGEK